MKRLHTPKQWREAVRKMRESVGFPPDASVRFRRMSDDDNFGETKYNDKRQTFTVYVSKETTQDEMLDTLVHEMAHVFDWPRHVHPQWNYHGPTWGCHYADIYTRMTGET